jgi:hypothetical protein
MTIVQHRVNTVAQLQQTPTHLGVELDIRDKYNELIITHDAFIEGQNWNTYVQQYQHQLCIANVKTEGIEQKIIQDFEKQNIQNYFLLDVSLPMLVKLSNQGLKNMAVRFSEYEPIELAMQFAGKVNWLWVDCFNQLPLTNQNYDLLKKHFKLCIVSPELQKHNTEMIHQFKNVFLQLPVDAVCTKHPELWV